MLEFPQVLIIAVIIILTILLLVLGVQAFLTLREFRKTVHTANNLMSDVKQGTNIAKIIGTVIALIAGKKFGGSFVDLISQTKDRKAAKEKPNEKTGVLISAEIKKEPKIIKRFFRRSKSL